MSAGPSELQRSPLDAVHRRLGAKMGAFAGWDMPIQYQGTMSEHQAVRERVGVFDLSHLGKVEVRGDGAHDALQHALSNDLDRLTGPGAAQYTLCLTDDGGIVDDLMTTRRGDHFYTVVNGATKEGDIAYLRERLPRAVVLDHMKEQALLALQGPKAVDALARLAPGVEQLGFMTGGAFTEEARGFLERISNLRFTKPFIVTQVVSEALRTLGTLPEDSAGSAQG